MASHRTDRHTRLSSGKESTQLKSVENLPVYLYLKRSTSILKNIARAVFERNAVDVGHHTLWDMRLMCPPRLH
jgi:hypothetical protein